MADQHSEPVQGGIGAPTDGPVGTSAATHRPGMVTFATVLMFVVAGLEAFSALLVVRGYRVVGHFHR